MPRPRGEHCPSCGGEYFKSSLPIHMRTCESKVANTVHECMFCRQGFHATQLQSHMYKCLLRPLKSDVELDGFGRSSRQRNTTTPRAYTSGLPASRMQSSTFTSYSLSRGTSMSPLKPGPDRIALSLFHALNEASGLGEDKDKGMVGREEEEWNSTPSGTTTTNNNDNNNNKTNILSATSAQPKKVVTLSPFRGPLSTLNAFAEAAAAPSISTTTTTLALHSSTPSRIPCSLCNRQFAPHRIGPHTLACRKASKARPIFDSSAQRLGGSDEASYDSGLFLPTTSYVGSSNNTPRRRYHHLHHSRPRTSNSIYNNEQNTKRVQARNWRRQHNELITAFQTARQLEGRVRVGSARSPFQVATNCAAPPTSNDQENHDNGREECPHCDRKFSPRVADKHIESCAQTIHKPRGLPVSPSASLCFVVDNDDNDDARKSNTHSSSKYVSKYQEQNSLRFESYEGISTRPDLSQKRPATSYSPISIHQHQHNQQQSDLFLPRIFKPETKHSSFSSSSPSNHKTFTNNSMFPSSVSPMSFSPIENNTHIHDSNTDDNRNNIQSMRYPNPSLGQGSTITSNYPTSSFSSSSGSSSPVSPPRGGSPLSRMHHQQKQQKQYTFSPVSPTLYSSSPSTSPSHPSPNQPSPMMENRVDGQSTTMGPIARAMSRHFPSSSSSSPSAGLLLPTISMRPCTVSSGSNGSTRTGRPRGATSNYTGIGSVSSASLVFGRSYILPIHVTC